MRELFVIPSHDCYFRNGWFIYSFGTDLPKNTFPFLLLGMAPPAAPVAFCNKKQETSYNKA